MATPDINRSIISVKTIFELDFFSVIYISSLETGWSFNE